MSCEFIYFFLVVEFDSELFQYSKYEYDADWESNLYFVEGQA